MADSDTIPVSKMKMPELHFLPQGEIDWSAPSSELIRFREHTRPQELLNEPLLIAKSGKRTFAFVAEPKAAYEILVTRTCDFPKAAIQQKLGNRAFGPGLSGTIGSQNARQRQACKPLVAAKQIQHVEKVSTLAADDAISRWLEMGSIDLYREMSELALQITWATVFGNNSYSGRDLLVAQVIDALHVEDKSDFVASARVVSQLTDHFMRSGRWKSLPHDNPLRAIADRDGWPGEPGLSQVEVKANALVFAASGHVTTGLTMAWAAWLLGTHLDYQENLAQIRTRNPGGENERRSLRNLINETLRLFPPGTEVMRDASESIEINGTKIPSGSMLFVSLYFLHRHNALWEEPGFFQPQRFLPENAKKIPKGAFMPFSGGDYGCSGMSFAWAEMQAVLSRCLERVQFEVSPRDALQETLEPGTCLYPGSALRCKVNLRH